MSLKTNITMKDVYAVLDMVGNATVDVVIKHTFKERTFLNGVPNYRTLAIDEFHTSFTVYSRQDFVEQLWHLTTTEIVDSNKIPSDYQCMLKHTGGVVEVEKQISSVTLTHNLTPVPETTHLDIHITK